MKELQEEDVVLCTVTKIEGTIVFVDVEGRGSGTITFSEIAPGRIRNIREYAIPNKKIVCKILRISPSNIELSLRRVGSRERDEVMEKYKLEKTSQTILKSILKDKSDEAKEKILSDYPSISDFFLRAKDDESLIGKYVPKEFFEDIKKVCQKKKKDVEVKKIVKLKSFEPDGIKKIKTLFENSDSRIEIIYIAAGKVQIDVKESDYKKANQLMNDYLREIESKAKKNFEEFSVEDKK